MGRTTSSEKARIVRKPNFSFKGTWVYRVENEEGIGPFKVNEKTFNKERSWISKERRKREILYRIPHEEFDVNQLIVFGFFTYNPALRFGFANVQQLRRWFNSEELKKLSQLGYKVKRVWAERVLYGKDQCLFFSRRYKRKELSDEKV